MSKPTDKKPQLKEFCLRRTSHTYEYCYVMAIDWEDAEQQGHQKELDWEYSDSRSEINVEECD